MTSWHNSKWTWYDTSHSILTHVPTSEYSHQHLSLTLHYFTWHMRLLSLVKEKTLLLNFNGYISCDRLRQNSSSNLVTGRGSYTVSLQRESLKHFHFSTLGSLNYQQRKLNLISLFGLGEYEGSSTGITVLTTCWTCSTCSTMKDETTSVYTAIFLRNLAT